MRKARESLWDVSLNLCFTRNLEAVELFEDQEPLTEGSDGSFTGIRTRS